ncbi:hypothetical protein [Acinetobacter baumannii]|uniref:hypothetical protein n=1 Tax=Acinetobacter baumannii TaxID=470 RepID=UPI001CDD880E|nr:hypothetical protein [Acinetobacter baumannii]MCA4281402.1 hypothetical protein [Acinetobacter baumannii]
MVALLGSVLQSQKNLRFVCLNQSGKDCVVIQPVEINEVTIDPASNSYHILLAKDSHEYTKEELKRKFEEMKANGWEYIEDLLV